ncbi:MAG: hypothetical protein J0I09_14910 [Sphingobacteriia bacterium]|nr:hypothetical protein [Sphingobacteriia bacterium]
MKTIFLIVLILFSTTLFAQKNWDKKVFINGVSSFEDAFIFFPLLNDTIRLSASTHLVLDTINVKRKLFYCCFKDVKSRIYNLDIDKVIDTIINFKIPDKSFFDNLYKSKICPLCHKSDSVVLFIYGKPNERLIKRAEKGEVKLAGCSYSNTSPKMFCKRDNLEF